MLTLNDFVQDQPWSVDDHHVVSNLPTQIDGVKASPLHNRGDDRGELCELLTLRDGEVEPIVHVYTVVAAPKSVRAWVYHKRQWDRLAFTRGQFRVVLYDLRENSSSYGKLDILELGLAAPTILMVPPYVIHGVENYGDQAASFINIPTRFYDPNNPDKWRIPPDHPGVPYSFGR